MLIGEEAVKKLNLSHVLVIGLGGVGGIAAQALARSGVGKLIIADGDRVELSNLNRQIVASAETAGKYKAEALKGILSDINPYIDCKAITENIISGNLDRIFEQNYDYVIDAIDSMKDKIDIICYCKNNNIRIISATGAGNRLKMGSLRTADIYETKGDPVCRILRSELRKRGINEHKVVYSTDKPLKNSTPPAIMMFVPAEMGLMLAYNVITDLIN